MKIGSIGNAQIFAAAGKKIQQQSFSGLWGKEETTVNDSTYYDAAQNVDFGTYTSILQKEYYPFLDETEQDIEKVEKKYNKRLAYRPATDSDPSSSEHYQVVKIMPKLPVTAAEYNAYVARELLSKQELQVEDKLKGANLQRFLNVPPKQN